MISIPFGGLWVRGRRKAGLVPPRPNSVCGTHESEDCVLAPVVHLFPLRWQPLRFPALLTRAVAGHGSTTRSLFLLDYALSYAAPTLSYGPLQFLGCPPRVLSLGECHHGCRQWTKLCCCSLFSSHRTALGFIC